MTLDLTGLAVAVTGGVFSILATVLSVWITSSVNNKSAAHRLASTVQDSLGAIQLAATSAITIARPPSIPDVSTPLARGVQYVLDHAGDQVARFGLTTATSRRRSRPRWLGEHRDQHRGQRLGDAYGRGTVAPVPVSRQSRRYRRSVMCFGLRVV